MTTAKVGEREGELVWMDKPWFHEDGNPADLLCRVSFKKGTHGEWFRRSEIEVIERETPHKKETKMKEKIPFDKFLEISKALEVTLGTISTAERVPKKDKLLLLSVNFGTEDRVVVTNIGDKISPEALVGRQFPFITNLEPTKIAGIESTAMIVLPTLADGSVDFSTTPVNGAKLI